jgi:hypothetical protein
MPSSSAKQARLMRAVAHNPAFAKKVGISQSVGKEFMKADKRKTKKFDEGGETSSKTSRAMTKKEKDEYVDRVVAPFKSVAKNIGTRAARAGSAGLSALGGTALGISGAIERLRDKKESDKYFKRSRNALRSAGRSAKAVVMGEPDDLEGDITRNWGDIAGDKIPGSEEVQYRKGGSVKSSASRRADGIAQRGKTRGKFV